MSANRVINIERCEPGKPEGFVKLYAHGKVGLLFSGDGEYVHAAEECFKRSLSVSITLDEHTFVRALREHGAPEKGIHEFLDSCTLVDEVHLSPILN
jgi:hypothetical protein